MKKQKWEKFYRNYRIRPWAPFSSRISCLDNDWDYFPEYYSRGRTLFQTCRQYVADKNDMRQEGWKYRLRHRRSNSHMDGWDIEPDVNFGRSWKDHSKYRKQWMKNVYDRS